MNNVKEKMKEFEVDVSACQKTDEMTPTEFVNWLYDKTDENGQLVVPLWNDGSTIVTPHTVFQIADMEWNESDRDRLAEEAETLVRALSGIAEVYERLTDSEEENAKILSSEQMQIWRTYVRAFDTSAFDSDRIFEIGEEMETVRELEYIELREQLGRPLSEYEKVFAAEYSGAEVDEVDEAYYEAYQHAREEQAKQRVGDKRTAFPLVIRAMRVCRLMSLKAPAVILAAEKKCLVQALVFHACAKKVDPIETVD